MNGRIYDPTLGRFLQADPFIQARLNSQNYNRYSYVLNNPMSYTDPSGYFFKSLFKGFKKYWRVIAAAVVTWATAGAVGHWAAGWAAGAFGAGTTAAAVAGGALTGAIAGAAGGFVATGSLKGALQGAFTGAVFGGLGGYGKAMEWGKGAFMAGHGVAGGVISDLQGGKFGHGFFTAGIMKGVGMGVDGLEAHDIGKTVIMAIAGGTISKVTGGKFANGAVTSAIQFVVNQKGPAVKKAIDGYLKIDGIDSALDVAKAVGESRDKVHELLTKAKAGDADAIQQVKKMAEQYGIRTNSPMIAVTAQVNSHYNASVMKFQAALGADLVPMVAGEYLALASEFSGGALKIGLEVTGYAVTFTSDLPAIRTDGGTGTIEDLIKGY